MARFPDGMILIYKPNRRKVSVEVTTAELIKCKNCMFSTEKDVVVADGIISRNSTVCEEYHVSTNPEGYCWKAVRKDDTHGR